MSHPSKPLSHAACISAPPRHTTILLPRLFVPHLLAPIARGTGLDSERLSVSSGGLVIALCRFERKIGCPNFGSRGSQMAIVTGSITRLYLIVPSPWSIESCLLLSLSRTRPLLARHWHPLTLLTDDVPRSADSASDAILHPYPSFRCCLRLPLYPTGP